MHVPHGGILMLPVLPIDPRGIEHDCLSDQASDRGTLANH
jgi:hypothetical protein